MNTESRRAARNLFREIPEKVLTKGREGEAPAEPDRKG
jgi:hypothetical protein